MACSVQVGDVVYILGKFSLNEDAPVHLIEARVSQIKNRRYIAYTHMGVGTWSFSSRDIGRGVFTDKAVAQDMYQQMLDKLRPAPFLNGGSN